MKDTLRDQLIGTWKLEFQVETLGDGSAPVYPMEELPMGIIMYMQDG